MASLGIEIDPSLSALSSFRATVKRSLSPDDTRTSNENNKRQRTTELVSITAQQPLENTDDQQETKEMATQVLEEVPAKQDGKSHFSTEMRIKILGATRCLTHGGAFDQDIIFCGTSYQLFVHTPREFLDLTDLEFALVELARAPVFVWAVRVNFDARNIQFDFLRERPASGALLGLPGLCLLELPTTWKIPPKDGKPKPEPLELAVYDSETKQTTEDQKSETDPIDATDVQLLTTVRDRMSRLLDDFTPTRVHTHVTKFTGQSACHVTAMGYDSLQLSDIRQIAQWYPFHVSRVICSFANADSKRPSSITAVVVPYKEPTKGIYERHTVQTIQA